MDGKLQDMLRNVVDTVIGNPNYSIDLVSVDLAEDSVSVNCLTKNKEVFGFEVNN